MSATITFPFLPRPNGMGPRDLVPLLPLTLSRYGVTLDLTGLVDSGATFSVLPHDLGLRFGVPWASLTQSVLLGGAAGQVSAKLLAVDAVIGSFPPVGLIFAWAATNAFPVLLGQANFFFEFDVCLFRRRAVFEVQPATP